MNDCLFCKIVAGKLPCNKVYEDEKVIAFTDINPKAPVHILIIPKKHIASVADTSEMDMEIYARIMSVAKRLAEEFGLKGGYRLVTNIGKDGGQAVAHLHIHLLGGRAMGWPPG
jgi:histidine triad (HIT) family protein